ncbi:MAG: Rne/Rng family ribonuclease [Nitrospinae bacterium]|nr:Rne/Rng family ribonuclease [Nitrospinota bacterium]
MNTKKPKSAKKVMLINAQHPEECRAVILNNNIIDDYIVEHSSREQIKGNVYLGVINRVEPSIEAAFVDFGYKKFGFLPFKDVLKESYVHTGERKAKIRIQDVLMRGQKILVQVAKESRDAKGPSLNNALSIPGRFLVLMQGQGSAVSRKIEDESERKKLKDIVADFNLPENLGLIIRTAGVGRNKIELQKDLQMLLKVWEKIENALKDDSAPAPYLIYQEPDLVVRTVRDHYSSDTSQIIVDSSDAYKSLKDFARLVMPRSRNLVKLYKETRPLFSEYKVEEQIESIYERKVPLPSGGSIVIDIGEAMASIDVNSGKTKGGLDLEETAVTTNLEAAKEVARQLRLRDLGGLVVIDFIDMYQKKNKAAVEKQLKLGCKTDKARINLSRISKFGLLEMSRQRISPPVKDGIFDECSHCKGSGHVRSINSVVLLVFRKVQELLAKGRVKVISMEISSEIATYLLNSKMNAIQDLKEKYEIDLKFKSKPGLVYEDFKFEILETKVQEPEEESKAIDEEYEKEEPTLVESVSSKPEVVTERTVKSKPEGEGTQTKRKYSQRKPSARRGQSRGRGRRPYNSRRKPDAETTSASGEGSANTPAIEEKQFNTISNEVEAPIIPLPAPFVRPEPTPFAGPETEGGPSGSVPDGNVSEE